MMQAEWLTVFRYTVYATAAIGLVLTVLSLIYFNARARGPVTAAVGGVS